MQKGKKITLELHQIRYFLALSRALNFTRAAEECNVSQPALSRAISQLEGELGGELFRRERNLTHLTDLGQAVLPSLRSCFEASAAAKTLASEFKKDGHALLNLALSRSVEMELLSPILAELAIAFPHLQVKMFRGTPPEITEKLRNGEAEVAVAGALSGDWERLDAKKLYQQQFGLLLNPKHRLSRQGAIELPDLMEERLLGRPFCTLTELLLSKLKEVGIDNMTKHEVNVIDDLPGLVQANFGVGVWPVARKLSGDLLINHIAGLDLSRWVNVYTVFGRKPSTAARTFTNPLRVRDWSQVSPDSRASGEPVQ